MFEDNISFIKDEPTIILKGNKSHNKNFVFSNLRVGQSKNTFLKYDSSVSANLKLNVSELLDDLLAEEGEFEFLGSGVFNDQEICGFKTKQEMHFNIITNRSISIVNIISIPSEFVFEYSSNVDDYPNLLKGELGSLCRMIMMEDDKKLTTDALELKKALLELFEKIKV